MPEFVSRQPHALTSTSTDTRVLETIREQGTHVAHVAIIGNGQLGGGVARILGARADITLTGPTSREEQAAALASGADVVVIATGTRLADVSSAIDSAVRAGSNVIVSAEESAYPWAVDDSVAERLDTLAQSHGVTVLGCGLNPGLIFDALLITLLGAVVSTRKIDVTRTVDISGFGPAVRARLGLGVSRRDFEQGLQRGEILGHAGFPQSISLVAQTLGVDVQRIDTSIEPILLDDLTVGVKQIYTGIVGGEDWYRATFIGHVDTAAAGLRVSDEFRIDASEPLHCVIDPGISSQSGSQAMVANSIDRVLNAPPGWLTVAEVPPAYPYFSPQTNTTIRK